MPMFGTAASSTLHALLFDPIHSFAQNVFTLSGAKAQAVSDPRVESAANGAFVNFYTNVRSIALGNNDKCQCEE